MDVLPVSGLMMALAQQLGGIAMYPFWVEKLAQQVQTVVKHMRFRIAFSWAQLSTGMGFHL
jgi:hypothetical protein